MAVPVFELARRPIPESLNAWTAIPESDVPKSPTRDWPAMPVPPEPQTPTSPPVVVPMTPKFGELPNDAGGPRRGLAQDTVTGF
jgi:hypothetical protein